MSISEELQRPRDLSGYTKSGLRAVLLQDVSAFLFQRQPDDIRRIVRQPEAHTDQETHYVEIALPAWKHITGILQVCVYAESEVELDHFSRVLTPLETADRTLKMFRAAPYGHDSWAKEFLLRIGRFLERRFGFHVTDVLAPYIFDKSKRFESEVTEVLGRVRLPDGESILVGAERWREIPRGWK